MKIKATISITPLTVHEVAIDLKKIPLSDGKGSFTVEVGTEAALAWRVRDTQEKKYKIEIKPDNGKIVLRGSAPHPIELKIPKKSNLGTGSRVFRIEPGKADE